MTGQAPTQDPDYRQPETFGELVLAHCRPQPAIPAVLVFVLGILLPVMTMAPGAALTGQSLLFWLFPVAILASCGLAVAAGFCSFFPATIWILLAVWAQRFIESGQMPGYNRYVFMAGIVIAGVMLLVQLWRAVTGRFVPTIRFDTEAED